MFQRLSYQDFLTDVCCQRNNGVKDVLGLGLKSIFIETGKPIEEKLDEMKSEK